MTCLGKPPSHLFLKNTGTLEWLWFTVVYRVAQCLHTAAALEEQGQLRCSLDLLGLYLCAAFGLCYICYPNVDLKSLQA